MQSRNLYIIGNGVIAKALAVALSLNHKSVVILRGSVEGVPAITENIAVEVGDKVLQAQIEIGTINDYEKLDGIILLANKSFGNKALAEKLLGKTGSSPIVFLQNGLHVEYSFIESGYKELYRCALFSTSEAITNTKVRFKPVAPSPIGITKGTKERLQSIVQEINTDIFSFRIEEDIQTVVWKKVICNCAFNSICPLLEIDNGVFHRNESALEMAKQVITECLAVAHTYQIRLTFQEVLDNLISLSRLSDGQKISTYQDILNKRETEIETLNLAIARAAGDIPVPVTTLLGNLAKLKSELSRADNL
jgi:2-dehydropantoate 2-reductase